MGRQLLPRSFFQDDLLHIQEVDGLFIAVQVKHWGVRFHIDCSESMTHINHQHNVTF